MSSRQQDSLRRFVFEQFPIRGQLVNLDATWRAMLERGDYPPVIRETLGEAVAATVLLVSTLKFDGMLTLQMQGEGPLTLLVVQCSSEMRLRGLAHWKDELTTGDLQTLTGDARLTVTIDTDPGGRRYQGIVPVTGVNISECLQSYFETSEQLRTQLWLAADETSASGMLLQRLPEASQQADVDDWPRVTSLAATLTDEELLNLPNEEILHRLFHEEDVRLFGTKAVSFRCDCTRDRVVNVLKMLGPEEVRSVIEEEGEVNVACEFCNKSYRFDSVDVETLLASDVAATPSKSVH